jgi:hypothetical protein
MEFDAFLGELCCFLGSSHTVDRAVIDFPIVHLACFLGELRADIVGVLGEMVGSAVAAGAWMAVRSFFAVADSRGAMIAFSTLVEPHCGQVTRPRLACLS